MYLFNGSSTDVRITTIVRVPHGTSLLYICAFIFPMVNFFDLVHSVVRMAFMRRRKNSYGRNSSDHFLVSCTASLYQMVGFYAAIGILSSYDEHNFNGTIADPSGSVIGKIMDHMYNRDVPCGTRTMVVIRTSVDDSLKRYIFTVISLLLLRDDHFCWKSHIISMMESWWS